jgi:hypothetical protein
MSRGTRFTTSKCILYATSQHPKKIKKKEKKRKEEEEEEEEEEVTHNKLSWVEKQREGDENIYNCRIITEMERDTNGAFEC